MFRVSSHGLVPQPAGYGGVGSRIQRTVKDGADGMLMLAASLLILMTFRAVFRSNRT